MKILFLVTEDYYFWSHRLELARRARRAGAEVLIMTHVNKLGEALREEGFAVIPWQVSRGSLNPLRELSSFLEVVRVYRRVRPDLVHHVALKPVVDGGLAARFCGGLPTVNAVAGLGEVFIGRSRKMSLVRMLLLRLLRLAMSNVNSRTIVQNTQNRDVLIKTGVAGEERIVLIRGVGVNLDEFLPSPEPSGVPLVMLASRMLWSKGVGEFIEAARILRRRDVPARFVLVGDSDSQNPSGVPATQLRSWAESGIVEWWGYRDDMAKVLSEATIVCLPSYAEGLPKVLIEAAACARPIITTDTPGCRDVVRHGESGLLVPARNAAALAEAVIYLLSDLALRASMGRRGREIATREFSSSRAIDETFAIYRELLGARWPDSTVMVTG
jgi:glycosyltransferase involved in cell wall biosynthesis